MQISTSWSKRKKNVELGGQVGLDERDRMINRILVNYDGKDLVVNDLQYDGDENNGRVMEIYRTEYSDELLQTKVSFSKSLRGRGGTFIVKGRPDHRIMYLPNLENAQSTADLIMDLPGP